MNKKLLKSLLMASLAFSVVGCGESTPISIPTTSDVPSTIEDSTPSTSIEEASSPIVEESNVEESVSENDSTPDEEDDEYYKLPDLKPVKRDLSVGGDLIDIEVGRDFMTGADYVLSYSMGSEYPSVAEGERVEVSNSNVISVTKNGKNIDLHCNHAGRSFLTIYDSNDIIRYRGIVTVVDPIPLDYMEEYLVYDADYWKSIMGWGDSYVITFLDNGVYTLTATFSNELNDPVTGTYAYVGESWDGKDYEYAFTDEDIARLGFTGFYIAKTGTFMYLQEKGGTASILFPKDKAEEYLASINMK